MTYGFISIEYPDCDRIEDIAENLCANVKGRPCILQTTHKGVLVQAGPSDTPSKIVEKFNRAAKQGKRFTVFNTTAQGECNG